MSNTHIIDSLSTLFSMSTTAVLGAQEQFIAFMNPAAQELFRGDRTNHKLSELLPDHITEATATEFVTSAMVGKRHVIVSVTSFGAFRLFSLEPQDENTLRVTGVDFSDLSSNGFGLTVALGVAEKHNGTILLESNAWNGTTFHVVLSTVLPESTLFRAPRAPYVRAEEDPVMIFLADQIPKT